MSHFLIFYAPFIVVCLSIAVSFWAVSKDDLVE
ncbi:cytochrome bd oxidase small subunit CydS [Cytobacillus praedii]